MSCTKIHTFSQIAVVSTSSLFLVFALAYSGESFLNTVEIQFLSTIFANFAVPLCIGLLYIFWTFFSAVRRMRLLLWIPIVGIFGYAVFALIKPLLYSMAVLPLILEAPAVFIPVVSVFIHKIIHTVTHIEEIPSDFGIGIQAFFLSGIVAMGLGYFFSETSNGISILIWSYLLAIFSILGERYAESANRKRHNRGTGTSPR